MSGLNLYGYLIQIVDWLASNDRRLGNIEQKLDEAEKRQKIISQTLLATFLSTQANELAIAKLAASLGDLSGLAAKIQEIHDAVVPEPVTRVVLVVDSQPPGGTAVDIQVGQKSTLTYQAFGASGNPTVPKGAPVWSAGDQSNFTFEVAPDGQSATLTATGAEASACSVGVNVDGVDASPLSFTIVAAPAEAVATVVLSATQPA